MIELDKEAAKRKPSGRILRAPYYDHRSDHPSDSLTPTKLAGILREAEDGDITRLAELYEDILDKDPTIFAALDTRKGAVLSKPWDIIPKEDATQSRAKRQIARIKSALDRMSLGAISKTPGFASEYLTFSDLRAYLLDATGRGFVAAALDWDRKTWEPISARQVAQKHFISAHTSKFGPDYNPYEIRFRTMDSQVDGVPIEPYQFIFHFSRDKAGIPSRLGLLRTLAWWYLFKNYAVKHYVKFAERYGMPFVYGQYDEGASEADITVLETAVKNLGADAGAVFSKAASISTLDVKASADKGELFTNLTHIVNQEISKAVLGRSSATELNPGTLGGEDTTSQVQEFRIERDAQALEDTINTYLVEPMALFTEGEVLCYFKIRYEEEESQNAKMDRYVKAITAGARIGEKHFYETFEIPEPGEGERVIVSPNSDPMAAALAGAIGGSMANKSEHGRVFANAALYANATGRNRSARIARKQTAIRETDELERRAAEKFADAYAVLVDGLPVDELAAEEIQTEKFRKAFSETVRDTLKEAMQISARELMVKDMFGDTVIPNKINPFEVKNLSAIDWLEYMVLSLTEIEGETLTLSLSKRIKDELLNFELAGITPKEFYSRILDSEGIGKIGRGHLQTVLRTNIATARSSAMELAIQKNPGKFPAWQYVAVIDNRTRADHSALDGKVFAWSDRKFWPPLGFNCRCEGSPIHETEMEEQGYELASSSVQDTEIPRGFGSDTRTNYARWVDKQARSNENIRKRLETNS